MGGKDGHTIMCKYCSKVLEKCELKGKIYKQSVDNYVLCNVKEIAYVNWYYRLKIISSLHHCVVKSNYM